MSKAKTGQKAPRRRPDGLSKNESLVWQTMADRDDALKAYEILDRLKDHGVRAPMTVYRALEGLETKGHVHKLDGINAFILCNHKGPHLVQTFLVCENCASVSELEMVDVEADILLAVRSADFQLRIARLEIKGRCRDCPN